MREDNVVYLVEFFRKQLKKVDPIPKEQLEPLLFAIAYATDREEFRKAAEYVLRRY